MNEKILEILRKNNYPDGEHDDDELCAIELEQLFDAEVNKMVSERFDHLINEMSKDDDVFDKMNCLIGYLERWWNNPQSYPPVELKSVIDEAIEYLKSRESHE